jgi:putative ABC transport system permease protein
VPVNPPPRPLAAGEPPARQAHARAHLGWSGWSVLCFLAWRNLWRNRLRSLLTAGGMVAGLTLMIAYLALIDGMFRQMVGFATDIRLGHIQVHRQAYLDDQDLYALLPWGLVRHLEQTTPYAYAPRLYAAGLASAGDSSSGALLEGIDPLAEVQVTDLPKRIRSGRFDLEGSRQVFPRGPKEPAVPEYPVVIGYNLARNLQLHVGSELVLITQAADGSIGNGLFEVRGVLNSIDPAFDRMGVLMSLDAFNSLMFITQGVHELAVHVYDVGRLDAARDDIAAAVADWPGSAALAKGPGGAVRVQTWKQINPELNDMINSSEVVIYMVAVIVFVIAAMGILNTMLMATYERRQELAILLALGMGRGAMMAMVLLEALFLGIFGTLAGCATGSALAWYLQVYGMDLSRWMPQGLDFLGVIMEPVYYGHLRPQNLVISSVMLLATSLLAALVPSWRTTRLNPARALHG